MLLRKLRPGDLVTIGDVTLEVMPSADIPRLQISAPLDQRVEITKGKDAAWSKNPGPIQTGDCLKVGAQVAVHVKEHSAKHIAVAIDAPMQMPITHTRAPKATIPA